MTGYASGRLWIVCEPSRDGVIAGEARGGPAAAGSSNAKGTIPDVSVRPGDKNGGKCSWIVVRHQTSHRYPVPYIIGNRFSYTVVTTLRPWRVNEIV